MTQHDFIDSQLPALIELRHDLHRHPQLAYRETYAGERVQQWLAERDIAFEAGLATTGVVAWIEPTDASARAKPAVGLRADMDALPIQEQTALPYASESDGLMHACGHDGHTTILLGAAAALAEQRERLPRPIKLFFQPAEEGQAGAKKLIEAGAMGETVGGHAVDRMYGLHGWPRLALGCVGTRVGPLMSSMDDFAITVRGRGGHGAQPHLAADPITAAASIITALQTIVSRNVDPTDAAVVSIGRIHGGAADNVIPETVELGGTLRTLRDEVATRVSERIGAVAEQVAAGLGCRAEVTIRKGYPALLNEGACVEAVLGAAKAMGGADAAVALDQPSMTSEDFAFYAQQVPAAFFFLGLRPPGAKDAPDLHTPTFDFNDEAIAMGVRMLCALAVTG